MSQPTLVNAASPYVLGHSERELKRLAHQARLIDPMTREFFLQAGLAPGMRVLDIGSGAGDVAMLISEIVGTGGEVVGIDRAEAAVATATERAAAAGRRNVSFMRGDPADASFDARFDAVVGRYVLMFQSDPAAMLRACARHCRSGGIVAFHEVDYSGCRSVPALAAYDDCCRWVVAALATNSDTAMALKIPAAFVAAGLPAPQMATRSLIGAGATAADCIDLITGLAGTLHPLIDRLGFTAEAARDPEALAVAIKAEAIARTVLTFGRYEVGAWCTR